MADKIDKAALALVQALSDAKWKQSDDPEAFVTSTSNLGIIVERHEGWVGIRFEEVDDTFSKTPLSTELSSLFRTAKEHAT